MKKRKIILPAVLLLVAISAGIYFILSHSVEIRADLNILKEEKYDTIFLSNYSVQNYEEEDYAYFRGMDIVKTSYEIPNGDIMRFYLNVAKKSGNEVKTVYLGIDPTVTAKEDVVIMAQENPDIMFEIILAYPRIDYWTSMGAEELAKVVEQYRNFAEWIVVLPNARAYFFSAEEWLVCNPYNYEDVFETNAAVSEIIMCNSDCIHSYMLSLDNISEEMHKIEELTMQYEKQEFTDCAGSDMQIVFIGDSIIGNYTGSTSVPGVVEGLTGATVYNCGYGGMPAAYLEVNELCLPAIVDRMVAKKLDDFPIDKQIYSGMVEFYEREETDDALMFVLHFGLNDYFHGVPIEGTDPYDEATYCGAIRLAVAKLQAAYPQARIVLMTPTFTALFDYGETPQGNGGCLEEYADAVIRLGDELGVEVADNYRELPVTEANWQEYLEDGCHLNEQGRYLLGNRVASLVNQK